MTAFRIFLIALSGFLGPVVSASQSPLRVEDVLTSVKERYPPLLAAWIQQDFANGRVRQAQGAFDPILGSSLNLRPLNYYDGSNAELLLEKPLEGWGGGVYGGYRLSSGSLPDYDRKLRTADGGEAVLGFRVPLLRDGSIDGRRARLAEAELDRELADPIILRQYLDFIRGARISYFNWLAAGKRLDAAEEMLAIAKNRDESLAEMVRQGALAEIVGTDNRRLVVSREIATINARRAFESAGIALSLFHRNRETGHPIIAGRQILPAGFPNPLPLDRLGLVNDSGRAAFRRPESRQVDLLLAKNGLERKLATNNLKPNLDFGLELNQALSGGRPSDIDETELTGILQFSIPIGRNEAKGRLQAADAELAQLQADRKFTRERILADAADSHSAVMAAYEALARTRLNVELSEKLETAENEKFSGGASDLLALQIREQATFDAKVLEIDATLAYFKALADYKAAIAEDAPARLLTPAR